MPRRNPKPPDDRWLWIGGLLLTVGVAALLLPEEAWGAVPPGRKPLVPLPPARPGDPPALERATMTTSTTPSAFLAAAPSPGAARERYFESHVDAPTWVRVPLGQGLEVNVSADYVRAQGVRVPLWPSTAQRVADRFDAIMPTKRLVDAIWRAATVKVSPRSMTPRADAARDSNKLLAEHEVIVNAQVGGRAGLADGSKKSIVVGRGVTPGKVCIYGWHQADGTPIQPVFCGHSATYGPDYSHGTRLISKTAYLNGQPVQIETLFADPRYAPLLCDGGTLTPAQLRYAT